MEQGFTPQFAVVLILEGQLSYRDQHQAYEIVAGQGFQRWPQWQHEVLYSSDCQTCYAALPAGHAMSIREVYPALFEQALLKPKDPDRLFSLHQRLHQEVFAKQESSPLQRLHACQKWIFAVLLDQEPSVFKNDTLPWLKTAVHILQSEEHFDASLQDIARLIKIPYHSFRIQFKRATGISPREFRINWRMERAKEWLDSGARVSEVADRCHYKDIYTFSHRFKQFTGCSPKQWKERLTLAPTEEL